MKKDSLKKIKLEINHHEQERAVGKLNQWVQYENYYKWIMLLSSPFLSSLPPKQFYQLNKYRRFNTCDIPQQAEDNDDDNFLPTVLVGTSDEGGVDSDEGDDTRVKYANDKGNSGGNNA